MTIQSEGTAVLWAQPMLFPPETVRVELVVFLDGPTETGAVGWKVTDATTDDVLALGVDRSADIDGVLRRAIARLSELCEHGRAILGPF